MPITRNMLFSAAPVFAIALVAGAWITSTRGGEEAPMEITALLDGYSNPPTKLEGTLCIAHVATNGHEVEPVEWDWSSTAHSNFNLNQRQIQDNLGYSSGNMRMIAEDAAGIVDTSDVYVAVSSTGETCEG